ncbi:MAG: UvrB/UvrC motif-containing protein, partial [Synergistaceae bacterium]|nr:UvrB/UvrC motif-containing protein [Synergistaceae bacterium]
LGKRENYEDAIIHFNVNDRIDQHEFLSRLVNNYYERNDYNLESGKFRVRGDTVEIFPAYEEDRCIRITFYDDEIERIDITHPLTGKIIEKVTEASIFPAQHYVTQRDAIEKSAPEIQSELAKIEQDFISQGKYIEAQRIKARTLYDLEMLNEAGYCSGIENYSVYLDGRQHGEPPGTLIDFLPDDFIMIVDESHITLPQVRGMFNGDRARKKVLVENGFRLPSCLDNRPLEWHEFEGKMRQAIFVSATPGDYELQASSKVVEQIIRPTGIPDPEVEVLPAVNQIDDLIGKLRECAVKNQRALVLTLTKRSSEDLADYLTELKFRVKYIHSELNTFERAELIRDLRAGNVDVLVGINLLREGMDLPEVTLVAILDADREGYLRSYRALIQIMGRAARNIDSKIILYADDMTESISKAVSETKRRREKQIAYNKANNITPKSIIKDVADLLPPELAAAFDGKKESGSESASSRGKNYLAKLSIKQLEQMMWEAVNVLDFEKAALIRDIIEERS